MTTPGEAASVMTSLDGYEMARKGRAGAALAVSAIGSFIAGTRGVVALTLSPMMSARLLRAGGTERGFSGWINRRFDSVRRFYMNTLASTLRYRPVVLVLWVLLAGLMIPFYMFSMRELAPAEDQGVVFGVIQAAPNATIDQTNLFAAGAGAGRRSRRGVFRAPGSGQLHPRSDQALCVTGS